MTEMSRGALPEAGTGDWRAVIERHVDGRYARALEAFAPGSDELRGVIAATIEPRISDILAYARTRSQSGSEQERASTRAVTEWEQNTNATRGLQLVLRWIATGQLPTKADIDGIAVVGRRAATITGEISRIILACLAWRDGAEAVAREAAAQYGAPPQIISGIVEGINLAYERAMVAIAKEFDEQVAVERAEHEAAQALQTQSLLMDPATGLKNRRAFLDLLGAYLLDRRRNSGGDCVALFLLGVTELSRLRVELGEGALTEVIGAVAGRLARLGRPMDVIARMDTDRFAMLCTGLPATDAEAVTARIGARIMGALAKPVGTTSRTAEVATSIGSAWSNHRRIEADTLLKRAQEALDRAIADGPGAHHVLHA